MKNTATIHIKTDFNCIVYDYGRELGTTNAGTYFDVELRKGEHELTFELVGDMSIRKTISYVVEHADRDYRLLVEIVDIIYEEANAYLESKEFFYFETAFYYYKMAAQIGYSKAQNSCGNCYRDGDGVEKDLTKAVEWYTKAAMQGYAPAQYNLGVCFKNGEGVGKNHEKAIEWFSKAAEQGFADAQFELGVYYQFGLNVERDLTKALEWYTKAALHGNKNGQKALEHLKQET